MQKKNIIREKSYEFAISIVQSYQELKQKHKNNTLFTQLLKSGTSIGANVEEAIAAQSRKDFLSKIYISYKEAREVSYWLRLLTDTGYLDSELSSNLQHKNEELIKILSSITKTTSSPIPNS